MFFLVISLSLCALMSFHSIANEANYKQDNQSAEKLAVLLANLPSVRAVFEQHVNDSDGSLIDESSGWMAWQRPDKFRWEVVEPFEQSIVIDAQTYSQFDRDLDQLIIEPLSDDVAVLPNLLLSGNVDSIVKSYTIIEESIPAATSSRFKLIPLKPDSLFTSVNLEFNRGELKALQIIDDLSQVSHFEFTSVVELESNNESLFSIEPGADTDIIRQ